MGLLKTVAQRVIAANHVNQVAKLHNAAEKGRFINALVGNAIPKNGGIIRATDGGKYIVSPEHTYPDDYHASRYPDMESSVTAFHAARAAADLPHNNDELVPINVKDYLTDQNGIGASHLKDDQKALAHFDQQPPKSFTVNATGSQWGHPSGATYTVAGSLTFKRNVSSDIPDSKVNDHRAAEKVARRTQEFILANNMELEPKSFARDFIKKLDDRLPRKIFLVNEDGKKIFTGEDLYIVTRADVERCFKSHNSLPNWRTELLRLANAGKVDAASIRDAITQHNEASVLGYDAQAVS